MTAPFLLQIEQLHLLRAGLIAMGPAAVFGEKHNKAKEIFLLSIALFIFSFLAMGFANSDGFFAAGVITFFIAFNMMEPLVQSMISKYAKVHQKGAALGIGNSVAYFATFIGGTLAGIFLDFINREALGAMIAIIGIAWFIWTLRLQKPIQHAHLYISLEEIDQEKLNALEHDSIAEWYINESENLAVIKYHSKAIEEEELKAKILKG